jgi:hypothetical protein
MITRSSIRRTVSVSLVVMFLSAFTVASFRQSSTFRNRTGFILTAAAPEPSWINEDLDQRECAKPVIRSVRFYAWWWSKKQLKSGINPKHPPRKSYLRIDLWKDAPCAGMPYPDKVDIVCEISNPQHHRVTYSIEFTYDLLVAPIGYPCWAELARITEEVSWSGKVKVGKIYFRRLVPGQTTSVILRGLNIRNLLKHVSGDRESGYLWIWKLRAGVSAKSIREPAEWAQSILPLMPRIVSCGK